MKDDLLEAIAKHEWTLRSHREKAGDGWAIWWNVFSRRVVNVSGHPQPTPQAAIRAALAEAPRTKGIILAAVRNHAARIAAIKEQSR